jgi:succinate-semialdehyde dehydrogenase/glutarate-semialdehyde dehydrogenase
MAYQSVNPFSGILTQTFETMSDAQLEAALAQASSTFQDWRLTSYRQRSEILNEAASLMRKHTDHLAQLVTEEMGKLYSEAKAEVKLSAEIIEYYSENAEKFLSDIRLKPLSGKAEIVQEPLGILFGVEPWNFPYYQLVRFAAPNLMIGNVILVKHAASVPQCAVAFEKLWLDAGAPKGVYTNLFINYDQVNTVIDDRRIKGVALTGSAEAGKTVASRAGLNLKKSTMELGGSDAFIVLADAEIEKTVRWAMWAKMNNMGQCCVAAKRFILLDSIADQFLEKFKSAMSSLKAGDPMDPATNLAPLSSEAALLKVLSQVNKAVSDGANIILGGNRVDRTGSYMQPTILTDVKPHNSAYNDEIFGPVAIIFRVKTEEEAVQLANDSLFGLGGLDFYNKCAKRT